MRGLLGLLFMEVPVAAQIVGSVVDLSDAPVAGVQVSLRDASGVTLKQSSTDSQGAFALEDVREGMYALAASAAGFEPIVVPVRSPRMGLKLTLSIAPVSSAITVSASRGLVEDTFEAARSNWSIAPPAAPAFSSTGLILQPSPAMVQQTTPGQSSPYLRGLTGYQTLILVDGVRFNTSMFRSGPNQYLGFITADQVQRLEAVLGPAGAAFGSDALGGAVQVITQDATFATQPGWSRHGALLTTGATGDLSGGAAGKLSLSSGRYAFLVGGSARRHNDLRPGAGWDSHHVFTRFFGMPLEAVEGLVGGRLAGTAFSQWSGQLKAAARWNEGLQASLTWLRSGVEGLRSYRDLWGGLGRTLSDVRPQTLDLIIGRLHLQDTGPFDSLSGHVSWNTQSDGSLRQGQKATDPLTEDLNGIHALGTSLQASSHLSRRLITVYGGEFYKEKIRSTRFEAGVAKRAQYPDDSTYRLGGAFGQAAYEWRRIRLSGGGRWTVAAYGAPGLGSRSFHDLTYHGSLSLRLSAQLAWHLVSGRGFRAPNLNDLGSVGLTGNGFEVPVEEAPGALVASDASETALSRGVAVKPLEPEKLHNAETGFRWRHGRWKVSGQYFFARLSDPIVRRTLLFPLGSAPASLGGQPVSVLAQTAAQKAQGVVAVATPVDPRAVKTFENDGRSIYQGLEAFAEGSLTTRWSIRCHYSFLAGRDLDPNRPARRLPPQAGGMALRYAPTGRRPWLEFTAMAAGPQNRLNPADADDERIGASRRRRDIADFFYSVLASPYIEAGRFTPTGETLLMIQNRVLPGVADSARIPLYARTPGWMDLSIHGGWPINELIRFHFGLTNLFDKNYRIHGSGADAMGRSFYLGLAYAF